MLNVLLVAVFAHAGTPQDAPTPNDVIDVVTVDDAGHPVGGIGVELDVTFDPSVVRAHAKQTDPTLPAHPIVVFTDDAGRARFSSPSIGLWRELAPKRKNENEFVRTRPWVRAIVPLGSVLSRTLPDSSFAPVKINVGAIETVELRLRDARDRPLAHDADAELRFDDGETGRTYAATMFAHRGDRLIVPIAAAKLAKGHVRGGRGDDRTASVALHAAGTEHAAIDLAFAPGPRITGNLRTPAGEPVAASSILVAPVHPRVPCTCMRYGEQTPMDGWSWTYRGEPTHGTPRQVPWEDPWAGRMNASRIDTSKTADDGAFSVVIPLDASSAASTFGLEDRAAATVLRIEVHHEHGQCWLADVPFDASMESGTIDVGTIALAPDSQIVCGRVVDDRGDPIESAYLKWTESVDSRDVVTSKSPNTDASGRFRVRIADARSITASKDGYLSPPPVRVEPGTIECTIQLERCATLLLECTPPATLVPERFELRWRRADRDDRALLHQWSSAISGVASGELTVSLCLSGVPAPVVERTLTIAPGATQALDLDLRDCGLVTLRVKADGGGVPLDARVLLNGTNRSLELDATGVARFAIAMPTVALTIQAPGFADVSGVFAHGEHAVVLSPTR